MVNANRGVTHGRSEATVRPRSDDIREGAFGAAEKERSGDKNDDGSERRDHNAGARSGSLPEQGPAKALDNSNHGIEAIHRPPRSREETRWIGDRGGEEPDLHEEGHRVLDIAILNIESGKP